MDSPCFLIGQNFQYLVIFSIVHVDMYSFLEWLLRFFFQLYLGFANISPNYGIFSPIINYCGPNHLQHMQVRSRAESVPATRASLAGR